ncbi:hypothetical protein Hanom_Chr06g00542561 [Helianthus anomalus]
MGRRSTCLTPKVFESGERMGDYDFGDMVHPTQQPLSCRSKDNCTIYGPPMN